MHFDFSLSRESMADKLGGRVGADPGQITAGDVSTAKPYGGAPADMATEAAGKKGILAGLFRSR